jgi:hypothetical protein
MGTAEIQKAWRTSLFREAGIKEGNNGIWSRDEARKHWESSGTFKPRSFFVTDQDVDSIRQQLFRAAIEFANGIVKTSIGVALDLDPVRMNGNQLIICAVSRSDQNGQSF